MFLGFVVITKSVNSKGRCGVVHGSCLCFWVIEGVSLQLGTGT